MSQKIVDSAAKGEIDFSIEVMEFPLLYTRGRCHPAATGYFYYNSSADVSILYFIFFWLWLQFFISSLLPSIGHPDVYLMKSPFEITIPVLLIIASFLYTMETRCWLKSTTVPDTVSFFSLPICIHLLGLVIFSVLQGEHGST